MDGPIVRAPAIDGACLPFTRGGEFDLRIGQDLSIGYLSHDAETVRRHFEEKRTFFA